MYYSYCYHKLDLKVNAVNSLETSWKVVFFSSETAYTYM